MLAAWVATAGNLPLWQVIWQLPETHGWQGFRTTLALVVVVLGLCISLFSALIWPRWRKVGGVLFLLMATSSSYFMNTYGIVIDPSMVANVVNTDVREARDLLNPDMLLALFIGVVLPGIWWWKQPVSAHRTSQLVLKQVGMVAAGLLLASASLWLVFQDTASLMRNHKSLRYMINPFNTLYASVSLSVGQAAHAQSPLQTLGLDAYLKTPANPPESAPLYVLVVGETARAADFGLGGYERNTTPELQALKETGQITYFGNVTSCGTNTQTSVPCMFSHLGREGYKQNDQRFENLLDVLQRAGMAVLWIDNQSGCKGVCDRAPKVSTREMQSPQWCQDGECLDEVMLEALPEKLARLDPVKRAKGTVLVLHQMGSHGPAYYKRSPAALKPFTPECTSNALQDCSPEHIRNAYDNSIRYTDHFLAKTIQWLQSRAQPSALIYLSDHGESLGEKGLYLHGMPYSIAPKEQYQVPMLMWFSEQLRQERTISTACLGQRATQPWSHDHLFHTMLRLTQVQTSVFNPQLDILGDCVAAPQVKKG